MSIFRSLLSQSVKPCRVAKQNFFAVGCGNAGQRVFHRGPRLWIRRCDVGKIRFPENVVDTDIVAHLYADRFKPEIDINLPAEKFAGTSENSFCPETALFPLIVATFQYRAHPAQSGLGKHPVESGKFLQRAGENQIRHNLRRGAEVAQRRYTVGLSAGIAFPLWQGQFTGKTCRCVEMDGDTELLGGLPKGTPEWIG